MVRVPQVSQQVGGSVQIQAPGVVPVQDQTGNQLQQLGRGMQIAGQGVQSLGDEIRVRDDNARTREADALFSDYVRQALNPNDGYRSQLGKAASDSYEAVGKDIKAKQRELADTLRNDNQRQLFHRAAQARLGQAQGVIDGHAAQQTRIYEAAEISASIEGRKGEYQSSLGNPKAMAVALHMMRQDIAELAESSGIGPKEAKRLRREHETHLHASVAAELIDGGEFAEAADYLSSFKSGMTGEVHAKLSGQVTRLRANQRSADMAAAIVNKAPKNSTITGRRRFALEGAHAAIQKGMSEDEASRLLTHLDKLHSNEVELYAARQNAEVEQALTWFDANPQATFEDYPRTVLLGESGGAAKVLKLVSEQRTPTTAPGARLTMRLLNEGMPISDGPFKGRKLGDLTPAQFQALSVGFLSPEDQKTAEGYYARARGEATKDHYKLIEDDELIERTLRRGGVLVDQAVEAAKTGDEESIPLQRYDAARRSLQERLNAAGLDKDAKLSDKQSVMDAWVADKVSLDEFGRDSIVSTGALIDSDTPYVEVLRNVDGRQETAYVDPRKISEGVRATIVAARRSKGLPISEELIAQDSVLYEEGQLTLSPPDHIEQAYQDLLQTYGGMLATYQKNNALPYILPDGLSADDQARLTNLVKRRSGK